MGEGGRKDGKEVGEDGKEVQGKHGWCWVGLGGGRGAGQSWGGSWEGGGRAGRCWGTWASPGCWVLVAAKAQPLPRQSRGCGPGCACCARWDGVGRVTKCGRVGQQACRQLGLVSKGDWSTSV
ncbi:hypothetical protein CALCODRAFT_18777 [Calocera cornea HHB12733]|uniref:Uncharacterized protein n=1 Tax=Calocera cornea HHB12733 TaxID=1353952 RepID=A0A165E772_9BASI|nr:hypothetical protein CALCODRAFT_18777 [Calocera cornea HHB12733]